MAIRTLALYESGGGGTAMPGVNAPGTGIPGVNNFGYIPQDILNPPGSQGGIRTMALYENGGRGSYPQQPGGYYPPGPPGGGGGGPPGINSLTAAFGWAPQAMQPADPRAERVAAREAKVSARNMNRAAGGGGGGGRAIPGGWSHTGTTMPAGAGPGGYFPGTSGEAQNKVRQDAVASFQQWAQGKGLTPRQMEQATSSIAAGGGVVGGGGGGGGGGSNGVLGNLIAEYQKARDSANKANEDRYRDLLGGFMARYQRGMANLEGMGNQERSDIDRLYRQSGADINQDMVSRGLTNTTVRQNQLSGNLERNLADRGRLEERLRQQRIALDSGLSGDLLGVMERRTDEGPPDFSQLISLAQALGTAGPQGGGGGYGGGPVNLLGGGAPIFADASSLGFGSPFQTMLMPGSFGGRVNILDGSDGRRASVPYAKRYGATPYKPIGRSGAAPGRRYMPGVGMYDWGIGGDPQSVGGYA